MSVKKRHFEQVFHKLKVEMKESKHHVSGFIVVDGKRILPVHYSFGRGDVSNFIVEKFRKSLLLDHSQFEDLIRCSLGRDGYVKLLGGKGLL